MNKAVIALGSNIEPDKNIKKAIQLLKKEFSAIKESAFVKTAPIGYTEQDDFINGSVLIATDLTAEQLREKLKTMERKLGRAKTDIKYGPRAIDLDITVFNDQIMDNDFYERDFVKTATLELLPELKY